MSRHEHRGTPKVMSGILYTDDTATGTRVDSPAWFDWLTTASTFYFESPDGHFTAHHERRQRGGSYWIAYRRRAGILRRLHLGKPDRLALDRLEQVALALSRSSVS
jgi:hypothetical protein